MIRWETGSLFDSGADALVCPVNCRMVMGAGLALEFARRFPGLEKDYKVACNLFRIEPGNCLAWKGDRVPDVIFFPTKDDWRDPSPAWMIFAGLGSLLALLNESPAIRSIAVPAVGCGLGGLPWDRVRPMILEACRLMPDRDFHLYPPGGGR